MGFSLYFRGMQKGGAILTVIENTLTKVKGGTWFEWFGDLRDRRDMSAYLKGRWFTH